MKNKVSLLKLNLIFFLYIWSIYIIYGLLVSFEIKGVVFKSILVISSIVLLYVLCYIYKPCIKQPIILGDSLTFKNRCIAKDNVIKTFEANPLEKVIFSMKSPEFDYSSSWYKKGLIVKTMYDSYLVENDCCPFLEDRKARTINRNSFGIFLFYLLSLFPVISMALNRLLGLDHLIFVLIMISFISVGVFRLLPTFYMGRKIASSELPLSDGELIYFKKITIIEGFAMSDRISVVPFKKPSYLDGLAIDLLFKRFIIINPRLFAYGSRDYLRFVLFHELCHIKHHDSSGSFILPLLIIVSSLLLFLFPGGYEFIDQHLPYLDYLLAGLVVLYFLASLLRRKNMERRADNYGIEKIGPEGVQRVYSQLGIRLEKL